MTPDEKYQEIVNSRKAATEDNKPETDKKPGDDNPSGVKADPPATEDKNPEPENKPEGDRKPEGDPKEKGEGDKKPSDADKANHAMAELRFKSKKENEGLKRQIADLQKQLAELQPKPQAKTSKDFEKPEDYEKYVRDSFKDQLRAEILEEINTTRAQQDAQEGFARQLREDLEKRFPKEVSDKVISDLQNPESTMSAILKDERAKPILDAITSSSRKADLLALMQGAPQMFIDMLDITDETRKKYRVYQLEDQINARYKQLAAKMQSDKAKAEKAASLPTTGTFGVNETGNNGVSGLSAQQRVERYKQELLKGRISR